MIAFRGTGQRVYRQIRLAEIANQQQQALVRRRSQQFGGHIDGYFVLFLRPKKLRYMSAVDYIVVHGVSEAIDAADAAEACEFKGWFPDTQAGYNQAESLAEELLKTNTFSIPTIGR